MNVADMSRRGLSNDDLVQVNSRRGNLALRVVASAEMRAGQTFIRMHWVNQFMSWLGANALTSSACDPDSKQPELMHAAIQVNRLALPWRLWRSR